MPINEPTTVAEFAAGDAAEANNQVLDIAAAARYRSQPFEQTVLVARELRKLRDELPKANEDRQRLRHALKDANAEVWHLTADLRTAESQNADLSRRLTARDSELEGSRRKANARGEIIDSLGKLLGNKNRTIESLRDERFRARLAESIALGRRDELIQEVVELEKAVAEASASADRQCHTVTELIRQRDHLHAAWRAARDEAREMLRIALCWLNKAKAS